MPIIWEQLLELLKNKNTWIAIAVILILCICGGYYWYSHTVIGNLRIENADLRDTVTKQSLQIEKIYQEVQQINTIQNDQQSLIHILQSQQTEIDKVMHRTIYKKPSLGEVAKKDPASVQYRVNKATKNVLQCFEKATNPNEKANCTPIAVK